MGIKVIVKSFLIILIVSNIFSNPNCQYSNLTGSFTFAEDNFKERNFDMCQAKWREFKKQNKSDTILYRVNKKNFIKFWNYRWYFFSEKYRVPFKHWDEVSSVRGPVPYKSGFQDF